MVIRSSWALACVPLLVGACGVSGGATYSGRSEEPRVRAEFIAERPSVPPNFERIGTLRASCTLRPGFRELSSEKLSDVDCSFKRLTWALRERGAQVGGEVLVGLRCHSNQSARGAWVAMQCHSGLARQESPTQPRIPELTETSRPAPSAVEVERIDEPSVESAWIIQVDFIPTRSSFPSRPRHYDSVAEVATMPISHIPLGDVMTRCDRDCSLDSLRHGLRVAAGRLGASDIVAVHCFRTEDGNACTGTAAIAEISR